MTRTCRAKSRRTGLPCKSTIIYKDGLCRIHYLTPEEAKAQSARGGKAKGRGKLEPLPVSFTDVRWIVDLIVSVVNGTRDADDAFEYLAPALTRDVFDREELRRSLEKIEPPSTDEPEPLDRLARAREHLLRLYYEGRVYAEELPERVLQ